MTMYSGISEDLLREKGGWEIVDKGIARTLIVDMGDASNHQQFETALVNAAISGAGLHRSPTTYETGYPGMILSTDIDGLVSGEKVDIVSSPSLNDSVLPTPVLLRRHRAS